MHHPPRITGTRSYAWYVFLPVSLAFFLVTGCGTDHTVSRPEVPEDVPEEEGVPPVTEVTATGQDQVPNESSDSGRDGAAGW